MCLFSARRRSTSPAQCPELSGFSLTWSPTGPGRSSATSTCEGRRLSVRTFRGEHGGPARARRPARRRQDPLAPRRGDGVDRHVRRAGCFRGRSGGDPGGRGGGAAGEGGGGRLRGAVERGAGRASAPDAGCDLVLVAVPPTAVPEVAGRYSRQMLGVTVTHVSSVQARPLLDIEAQVGKVTHVVGGHPIAGREQSGPDAAAGELFRDRAWVVCPAAYTAVDAVETVEALALLCGARPVRMDPVEHDELLARLSHAPQLVASALAAAVAELPPGAVSLAGSGLRDTTRLADSDVRLWTEIISANPAAVAHALRAVVGPLRDLADVLDAGDPEAAADQAAALLRRGQVGRALLPGKHGQRPTGWATASVVVPARRGALAELLAAVAGHDVNLEDLRVEHAPGQPEGAAELAVAPGAQAGLAEALRADGWSVTLGSEADR